MLGSEREGQRGARERPKNVLPEKDGGVSRKASSGNVFACRDEGVNVCMVKVKVAKMYVMGS